MKNKVILLGSVLLGTSWIPNPALWASDPNKVYTVRNGNRRRAKNAKKRMQAKRSRKIMITTALVVMVPFGLKRKGPNDVSDDLHTPIVQYQPITPIPQALPKKLPTSPPQNVPVNLPITPTVPVPQKLPKARPDKNRKITLLDMSSSSQFKKDLSQLFEQTFDELAAKRGDYLNWSLKKPKKKLKGKILYTNIKKVKRNYLYLEFESKDKRFVALGSINFEYPPKPHAVVACCFVRIAAYKALNKPYVTQKTKKALRQEEYKTMGVLEQHFEQGESYDDVVRML